MVSVKSLNSKFSDKTPERFRAQFDEISQSKRIVSDSDFTHETDIAKKSIDKFKTDVVDWSRNVLKVSGLQSKLDEIYGKNQLVGYVVACPIEQNGHVSRHEIATMERLGYSVLSEQDLTAEGEQSPSFLPEQQYKSSLHVAMACTYANYISRHRFIAEQSKKYKTPIHDLHYSQSFRDKGYEKLQHEHVYEEQKSSQFLIQEV